MAENIASLGIKVTSSGVKETSENLEKVSKSSEKAQKAIDKLLESYKQQEVKARSGKAGLAEYRLSVLGASEAEKKFAAETIKATEKLNEQAKALRKTEAQTTSTSAIMAKMSGVLATLGTYFSTRKIIEYADTWTTLEGRLKLVTKNTSELIAVQDKLFDLAQETRLSLEGTTDLYARVARSTESVTRSQNDLIQATENINKAMVISGSSVKATNAVIIQLGQGFASGTLQGEELRSVLEQTPRLAKAIADGMGVAVGELRKLGKEGKLTSEVVFKAILSQGDALEKEFGKVPKTVKQGLTLVENSILKFIGQMNESYGVTKTLAEWLTVLADNIGDVAKAGFVLLSAAIPATITAIGTATKALYALLIRNPIGLIAAGITSAIAAMVLYKDEIIKFGKTNAQALDWVKASWDVLAGGVVTWGKSIYDSVTKYFSGMGTILGDVAEYIYSTYTEGFSNILEASKNTVNGLIGEFVGVGKFIGQTAAFIYESFEVAFDGIIKMAIAVGKDLKSALSGGDLDFQNTIATSAKASEKSLANLQKYVSSTGEIFKAAFTTDYVGMFASEVSKVGNDISKKASEYHATRMANEKEDLDAKKASEKALADKLEAEKRLNEENEKAKKAQEEAAKAEKDRLKSIEDIISGLIEERDTLNMTKEQLVAYKLALLKATPAQIAFATAIQKEISAAEERKKVTADFKSLQEKLNPELKRQNDLMADFKIVNDAFAMGLIKTKDEVDKLKNALEFNSFSGAIDELKDKLKFEGTSFGNEIADGINNAILSMNDFNDQLDKNKILQKDIEKFQKEIDKTSDPELKAQKQKALDEVVLTGIESQLDAYRQLFGTTSQLFKENSKERKALHNLEMAFAMAEIAMNLQKTISAAYTAIMIQGTGDPYSAFGRIAAMTALAGGIVAAAGGSLSGGGSASAPTAVSGASQSTALGSTEQSQSITNAFSFLEDIESGQYSELKDISASMKDLNKNITGLVTSIVKTGGVKDFASVAGTSGGTSNLQNMFGNLLVSPLNTVLNAPLNALDNISQGNKIVSSVLNTMSIGLQPLSNFLSNIGNQVSNAIFGGSKKTSVLASGLQITPGTIESGQYSTQAYADIKVKKEGGLFGSDKTYFKTITDEVDQSVQDMVSLVFKNMGETMVDIAKGLGFGDEKLNEVLKYVFKIDKIDLKGLDTEALNKKLQEAFSTTTDIAITELFKEYIGKYQKVGEGLLETAVRLVGEKAVIMDVLELTNQGFEGSDIPAKALEVTQALIDMAGGLDNLTDAAAKYYDKFFTDAEKQVRLQNQLTESLGAVGLELPKTRKGYRDLVEAQKLNIESNQEAYVALLGLSEGADKYYTAIENGDKVLAENQKNILAINSDIEKSIAQMDMSPLEKSIDDITRSTAATIQKLIDLDATEDQLTLARLYGERQINATIEAERKNTEAQEKANQKLYDNKYVELLEAQGNSTEALNLKRKLELESLDDSVKEIQLRIWKLQDETAANTKAKEAIQSLIDKRKEEIKIAQDTQEAIISKLASDTNQIQLELLQAQGNATQALNLQRALEVKELSESLIPLKQQIYALQDKRKLDEMQVQILELEGKHIESVILQRKLEFESLTNSEKVLQNRIWQLQDEAEAAKVAEQEKSRQADLTQRYIELERLLGNETNALNMQRELELAGLDAYQQAVQKQIYAAEDNKKATEEATAALEKATEDRKKILETELSNAEDALRKSIDNQISIYQKLADEANKILEEARSLLDRSFEAEKEKITKRHEDLIAGLTLRLEEAQQAASDLESLFNSLADARKSLEAQSGGITYVSVQKQLIDALETARQGDLAKAKELVPNLNVLTSQSPESYRSEQDFKRDFFKTYNALSELEKISGTQLTEQQQIIKNLEIQIQQENTNYQATMDALQAQYDAVIGVNNSVVSFEQAVMQYQQAQYAADGANTLLKAQTEILNNQLNTLLNINVSILSVSDAINNLAAAQTAMAAFNAAQSVTVPAFADGGVHYGGLRIVGENGPEMEYTPPANITSNNDLKEMLDNTDVVRILREVKESIDRGNFAVAKNTGETAKVLKKFDYDGMPEQRTA